MIFEGLRKKDFSKEREEAYVKAVEAFAIQTRMYGNVVATEGKKIDPSIAHRFLETAKQALLDLRSFVKFLNEKGGSSSDIQEAEKSISELEEEIKVVENEVEKTP